jgi:hypothetical protein
MPVILLVGLLAAAAMQPPTITWTGERLTVQATDASLRMLLEEVAARTGLVVTGADRLAGRESVDIHDAHLIDALKTLLTNVNYMVTLENGRFHLRVQSMVGGASAATGTAATAGTAPVPRAPSAPAQGPIDIPGLTDRSMVPDLEPEPTPGGADEQLSKEEKALLEADAKEEKEAAAAELADLERAAAGNEEDRQQQMADALLSDYRDVRLRALHLLADVAKGQDPGVGEELVSAFSDHDVEVAVTAADLLASIPGSNVRATIETQLTPENAPTLQFAALRALALRADIDSIPAVAAVAKEGAPEVRRLAERLLQALQERAASGAVRR